jgi:hypothetical protein
MSDFIRAGKGDSMKKKKRVSYSDTKRFLKALAAFTQEAEAYVRHCEWLREEGMRLIERLASYERAGMFPPRDPPEPLHIVRHK